MKASYRDRHTEQEPGPRGWGIIKIETIMYGHESMRIRQENDFAGEAQQQL
jgi:hypothetical protein